MQMSMPDSMLVEHRACLVTTLSLLLICVGGGSAGKSAWQEWSTDTNEYGDHLQAVAAQRIVPGQMSMPDLIPV